jgi:hypothetical protein
MMGLISMMQRIAHQTSKFDDALFNSHDGINMMQRVRVNLSPTLNTACFMQVLLQQTMPSF